MFNDICDKHAPYREIKIRRQSLPWITPQIRHLMNDRYKTLLKAKRTNNHELWLKYRKLRNTVTHEVRSAKCKYYAELFDEVKDCKSYWKLVKNAASTQSKSPIMVLLGDGYIMQTSRVLKMFGAWNRSSIKMEDSYNWTG